MSGREHRDPDDRFAGDGHLLSAVPHDVTGHEASRMVLPVHLRQG